jgi:hypothetical protein
MRMLVLTALVLLTDAAATRAHWPITYVGDSAIHRMEGPVRQVTLLQTPAEAEKVRADECDDRNSECAIETGGYLKEPASAERLFSGTLLDGETIDPKYDARSLELRRMEPFPRPVAPKFIEATEESRPTGSPFHGMPLAGD